MSDVRAFPPGFLWGVSTSAHQVEGGHENNNWADWEQRGRIRTGERAGRACDWWENAERDFDLARELNLNALRMSVEWSRIEPEEGRFSDAALERYREMLQGLHARGLRPFVCLHHFTNPLWFEREGAFLSDTAVSRFERFATRVADALGDLCRDWVTFNEPNVYATMGYVLGEFPPGRRGHVLKAVRITQATLRAHAAAYRVLHERIPGVQVGFTQNLQQLAPSRPYFPLDRVYARATDIGFNRLFLRGLAGNGRAWASWRKKADALGTYDFVGFNHYGWMDVRFDLKRPRDAFLRMDNPPGMHVGDVGKLASYGGFDPRGLARIAESLAEMGKPIYVLEHGIPDANDRLRPWLVAQAAAVMHEAISRGTDLRGYFHWTLVDNFEWAEGYGLRFGLVGMDPATQVRSIRDSARLYAAIAGANGLQREDVARYAPRASTEIFGG